VNRPCAAAMRPYVKLLGLFVIKYVVATCNRANYQDPNVTFEPAPAFWCIVCECTLLYCCSLVVCCSNVDDLSVV